MGRQEYDRAVALEVYERARNAGVPELAMVPDQKAHAAMTAKAEAEVREFLEEKGVVSVPADLPHYVDLPVPAYLAPLDGFGEWTLFANTARPGEPAVRYIPKPSPGLGYFAASMAKDRRVHLSHEGIPGHAFQLALASGTRTRSGASTTTRAPSRGSRSTRRSSFSRWVSTRIPRRRAR